VLTVAGSVALLVVLTSFAAPWLSHRRLVQARDAADTNPATAVTRLDSALRWNRWDPAVHEWAGVIAERAGEDTVAADDYAKAATLTQYPWLEQILEARAAKAAGDRTRAKRACAASHRGNASRTHLYEEVCE
jgi:Mg-chelatase subunit ChlI